MTTNLTSGQNVFTFPNDFIFGAATASYQTEGAVSEDDRGVSIWDTFCSQPGKVYRGDDGNIACDSYHRYNEDLDILKSLNLNGYRFSISWPRILPEGTGVINQKGIDYYNRIIDGLLERNILPAATIYHWDLPQLLQDKGGWANRDTAEYLADYAAICADAFGDRVERFITINEPQIVARLGYRIGVHAPGIADPLQGGIATHHILLAHGLATQAIKASQNSAKPVGITIDLTDVVVLDENAQDEAIQIDREINGLYLDPVLLGTYPDIKRKEMLPPESVIMNGDMEIISTNIDFLGVNYYQPHIVRTASETGIKFNEFPYDNHANIVAVRPQDMPVTAMGWLVDPTGLDRILDKVHQMTNLPIYITENGCAVNDYVDPNGNVHDNERISYLQGHLAACWRAIENGINLKGYYHWSLLDNFEWAEGYSKRFGLVYVDFSTGKRTLKDSALYYAKTAQMKSLKI
jgi:beta-glucosidase